MNLHVMEVLIVMSAVAPQYFNGDEGKTHPAIIRPRLAIACCMLSRASTKEKCSMKVRERIYTSRRGKASSTFAS
jgi:hypothetical protein